MYFTGGYGGYGNYGYGGGYGGYGGYGELDIVIVESIIRLMIQFNKILFRVFLAGGGYAPYYRHGHHHGHHHHHG